MDTDYNYIPLLLKKRLQFGCVYGYKYGLVRDQIFHEAFWALWDWGYGAGQRDQIPKRPNGIQIRYETGQFWGQTAHRQSRIYCR